VFTTEVAEQTETKNALLAILGRDCIYYCSRGPPFLTAPGPHPQRQTRRAPRQLKALARSRSAASLRDASSNLRADVWRRLPAVASAKAGPRFGWQAGASSLDLARDDPEPCRRSLGPQALLPRERPFELLHPLIDVRPPTLLGGELLHDA